MYLLYRVKVTVEKILEGGICPLGLKVGDEFIYEHKTISDFCPFAFHELTPLLFTLEYGGNLPWTDEGTATMCCTDAGNPVVFKLERLDQYDFKEILDEEYLKKMG